MSRLLGPSGRPLGGSGPTNQELAKTVSQLIEALQHLGQRQQAMFQQQIHLGIHLDFLREKVVAAGIDCDTTSDEFIAYARRSYEEIQRDFDEAAKQAESQLATAENHPEPDLDIINLDDEEVPSV